MVSPLVVNKLASDIDDGMPKGVVPIPNLCRVLLAKVLKSMLLPMGSYTPGRPPAESCLIDKLRCIRGMLSMYLAGVTRLI